jgi:2-oxo-4-hydroxy-4-carboxy-5-ureidoimidazoline decarboxylase
LSQILAHWNVLPAEQAAKEILSCCGSRAWAHGMASCRPFKDVHTLLATSDRIWRALSVSDWSEAFESHPRIGTAISAGKSSAQSLSWSAQEQRRAAASGDSLKQALADGNREYERKFQRIFIVCATGKSATEILEILRRRLNNDETVELHEAAEQQRQIAQIRLKKWLAQ